LCYPLDTRCGHGRDLDMVRASESLERQLRHYQAESERLRQSPDAAAGADIQEIVAYANFIYDRIKGVDQACSVEVTASGVTPSEPDVQAVWDLYAAWFAGADADLKRAEEIRAKGERISGLDRLRQAWYEARAVLSIPPDRLARSARSVKEGRTRSLGEIRDELRASLQR
jgi:hypothetical protein